MKTPLLRALLREAPAVLAVVALLMAVFSYRSELQSRDDWISSANDHLLRLRVMDQVTGAPLPDIHVTTSNGTVADFRDLAQDGGVWILAPEECVACMEDVGEWNLASLVRGTNVLLLFSGVGLDEARRLASVGEVRFPFAVDESGTLRQALGLALPSTYLAIAPNGTVVMADAGTEEMRCRPGFPSRLDYMKTNSRHHADTSPIGQGETP